MGAVCTGALILAASGLLKGRRAALHWVSCEGPADRHPDISVEPDRIFVKDAAFWTSAGVTAGIDMALAMIAKDSGRKTAIGVARSLGAYMARPGGQPRFSAILNSQTDDISGKFGGLHAWITDNLDGDLRGDRLEEGTGMSTRNFARTYQAATGRPPAKAVEHFRVSAARDFLE